MKDNTKKATITYRFDGQRREARKEERTPEPQVIPLYQEEFQVIESDREEAAAKGERDHDGLRREQVVLNEFRTDFGTYRSPFHEETERVERIIRESGRINGETGYVGGLAEPGGREGDQKISPSKASFPEYASQLRDGGQPELSGWIGAEAGIGTKAGVRQHTSAPGVAEHESGHNELYREPFASGYEGYRNDGGRDHAGGAGPDRDGNWGEPQLGTRYARSSSTPPWTRIVLSVTGAVVTGVVFGLVVLSLFTDDSLPTQWFGDLKGKTSISANGGKPSTAVPSASNAVPGSGATGTGSSVGTPGGTAGQADMAVSGALSSDSLVTVNLPARTYSFLQNGIFSSAAAVQAAEAQLKKKGFAFASVSEASDKTTVYAGFALQKEEAAQLGRKLQADKVDVFVKPVNVPAAPKLKWTGKTSAGELSTYFQQGDKLVQMIGSLTILHLGETKLTAIEPASLEAIKSTHQSWIAASTTVKNGAAVTVAPALQQMSNALNSAVVAMDDYKKQPSVSNLWQTQSSLMQYVLAEKGMLTSLAAQ